MFASLNQALAFCKENHTGTLVVFDGKKPTIRPHHFQMAHDGQVYFILGANRNAVKYISDYPQVQWMTYTFQEGQGGKIVRIDGEATCVEDLTIKEIVFNNNYEHLITRFADGHTSPKLKLYTLKNAILTAYYPGNPTPIQEFKF